MWRLQSGSFALLNEVEVGSFDGRKTASPPPSEILDQ
jgi:hypothetical protein